MPGCFSPSISSLRAGLALLCGGAALWLAACAGSAVPQPTAKSVTFAERQGRTTTLASLKHGRTLYVGRCSNCHTLHQPKAFSPESWPGLVDEMSVNAELSEDQRRDITAYLVAVSAELLDTAGAQAAPADTARPAATVPNPYP